MKLSFLRAELEKMALWYGEDVELLFHGPDGHAEGAYGTSLRTRALTITTTEGAQFPIVIFEGAGSDGTEASAGHFEFSFRAAAKIEMGRGARGLPGGYPPGS
jgi:hypothetical protein